MSRTPPREIQLPPRPTQSDLLLGDNSALTSDSAATSPSYQYTPTHGVGPAGGGGGGGGGGYGALGHGSRGPRRSIRPSFATVRSRRASRAATTAGIDELVGEEVAPKLPTLVPGIRPAYSTPLPTLPMMVLCIAMLSELLSANLSTPFLLKMVEGFFLADGYEKNSETEAQVGQWAGNLVSVFFITQFATSLLWSSIADRHGRRAVLVASLAGSALAVMAFGTSKSLPEAICIRLIQGIFGGAVGVFRGSIRDITDETNSTRAYAILGFSWGFGGVMGPIIGGVFESPAEHFSNSFLGHLGIFKTNPYLLPTLVAGSILIVGAVLACFLSWDGGVRGGSRIELPIEKNEPLAGAAAAVSDSTPDRTRGLTPMEEEGAPSPAGSHLTAVPSLRKKRSRVLSPGVAGGEEGQIGLGTTPASFAARRDSRASLGTAYGYGGIRSKHPTLAARAAVEAARRVSQAAGPSTADDEVEADAPSTLGLAKKLLLANEENTFNLNDIWVSAVIEQEQAVFEDDDDEEDDVEEGYDEADESGVYGYRRDQNGSPSLSPSFAPGQSGKRAVSAARSRLTSSAYRPSVHRPSMSGTAGARRLSTASGNIPAIFANTGLQSPPAIAAAYDDYSPLGGAARGTPSGGAAEESDPFFTGSLAATRPLGGLSVISEGSTGHSRVVSGNTIASASGDAVAEKKPAVWSALPFLIISQYGLLALHNTVHDQIFLSFLVSPYNSGGLGLPPAKFSFLIALMCIFQLIYQFWLYPRLGPPLGRFSHLQMFRLGCSLYIPAYLSLPLLHSVTSADNPGGFFTMTLLTIITACRYCGGTLGYTSIMVLINAMSPPHVVGLANGLAQSTVSLARFVGPVIGGTIWSTSIAGNPAGYFKPFVMVTIGCAIQWSLSFIIR